jgi:hypothetical protein
MNLIRIALRRPVTVLIGVAALALACLLPLGPSIAQMLGVRYPGFLPKGMEVDIFPALNLPVIYVCQPYGGMDPAQMEGYLTNYYEYHFLYINGIKHVESKNVQGVALMKLEFHPGTNMAQAMAETINYVNRSQAFMPPGTVSPFVMRFDTGSVPVGMLVLSSETKTIGEIQDDALFKVRPMFAALPGVSAPPPFGGAQRSVVVTVDPDRLRAYGMSPEEVIESLVEGNRLTPSGNIPLGDKYPIVPVNSIVRDVRELESIPIRSGQGPPVYLRDIGYVTDDSDAPAGYALADGRRAVYILVNKRADASTLSVVNNVREALPAMRAELPDDIRVPLETLVGAPERIERLCHSGRLIDRNDVACPAVLDDLRNGLNARRHGRQATQTFLDEHGWHAVTSTWQHQDVGGPVAAVVVDRVLPLLHDPDHPVVPREHSHSFAW